MVLVRHTDFKSAVPVCKTGRRFPGCVSHFFQAHPERLLRPLDLAKTSGFGFDETTAALKEKEKQGEVLGFRGEAFFSKKSYEEFKGSLPGIVKNVLAKEPMKRNVKAEEIRRHLSPNLEEEPCRRMISDLCRDGRLVKRDGGFQVSGVSAGLSPQEAKLAALCLDFARRSGANPFSADTVWRLDPFKQEKKDIERVLSYLKNEGELVRFKDGRYVAAESFEMIKEKVKEVIAAKGVFGLEDIRDALGYGRRIGVIVLEYLDSVGFTSRRGEGRVLRVSEPSRERHEDSADLQAS
jgi:hypothetical protein